LRIILDGRPTQPGFRAHLGRGIGHYAQKLIEHLPPLSPENAFLILRDGKRDFSLQTDHKNLSYADYRFGGWIPTRYEILRNQVVLPRLLSSARADLVHFFCHEDAPLRYKGKMILTVHDLIPLALPHLYHPRRNWLYRRKYDLTGAIVRRAGMIIADSESTKKDIIRFYSVAGERIEVVYPGVDTIFRPVENPSLIERVKNKYSIKGDFVFYVGGIDPRKNIRNLLEAFSRLQSKRFPELYLVIGGDLESQREYPDLIAQIEKLRLTDKVKLVGYVSGEDLVLMYNAARLFIFPSLYEGFGLPPLEAMACGTPVVTSNVSSLPEVTGDAAILIDPANPDEIGVSMERVVSDENSASSLREKGLHRAGLFGWEKTAKKTLEVYRRLWESGP
jgi:glycosyltransferase involved in cell wall biosynthesis